MKEEKNVAASLPSAISAAAADTKAVKQKIELPDLLHELANFLNRNKIKYAFGGSLSFLAHSIIARQPENIDINVSNSNAVKLLDSLNKNGSSIELDSRPLHSYEVKMKNFSFDFAGWQVKVYINYTLAAKASMCSVECTPGNFTTNKYPFTNPRQIAVVKMHHVRSVAAIFQSTTKTLDVVRKMQMHLADIESFLQWQQQADMPQDDNENYYLTKTGQHEQ